MEKRLIAAIALSLLVLLSWSAIMPKPTQHPANKEVTAISTQPQNPAMEVTKPTNLHEEFIFSQKNRNIVFNLNNASIDSVIFKDKIEHKLQLTDGFYSGNSGCFQLKEKTADFVSFICEDGQKRIIKKFTFSPDGYGLTLDVQTTNLSNQVLSVKPQIILGKIDLTNKNTVLRFQDIFIGNKEKSSHLPAGKNYDNSEIKFVGLRDQYFCAILNSSTNTHGYVKKTNQDSEIGMYSQEISLQPKAQIGHSYQGYLGPQDLKIINSINSDWTPIIYYGTFDIIAQVLVQLLSFINSLVHNWGWAIIILSCLVYLVLFPLSMQQMRSMKEMQALQPKIEALRQELKNNPQKLNKEIMELYRAHKVNPLGGCLPLLLQMPIFFALYQALIRSTALRGAQFLWIMDLSAPDKLFAFKYGIPFLGNQINILPILMAVGMYVQQKFSSVKVTGEAAQQQKIMSIVMPIMFGVIFYQMPAGLVLYWFINSVLMLIYQFRIKSQA